MPAKRDWVGMTFGRWTVTAETSNPRKVACLCACGGERVVAKCSLASGTSQSCGCLQSELVSERFSKTPGQQISEKTSRNEKTGCLEWIAHKNAGGYGVVGVKGRSMLAHRLSWELSNGPIPKRMFVLHKCDNPACVEPSHLFIGDNDANMKDMASKGRGRSRPGEHSPNSKLTLQDAREIRRAYAEDNVSQTYLAEQYGVSQRAISLVVRGETYREDALFPKTLAPLE